MSEPSLSSASGNLHVGIVMVIVNFTVLLVYIDDVGGRFCTGVLVFDVIVLRVDVVVVVCIQLLFGCGYIAEIVVFVKMLVFVLTVDFILIFERFMLEGGFDGVESEIIEIIARGEGGKRSSGGFRRKLTVDLIKNKGFVQIIGR